MTIFEYLMVMVSIILGLGLTQGLRGLSKIVRSDKRCFALTWWTAFLVYLYVQAWWAFWDLNAVASWNQGYFTLILLISCSMFAATELLVPMGTSSQTDWREHFFQVRRSFFVVMILFSLLAALQTYILLDVPLTHPYRIMQVSVLGLHVVGFVSPNPRIHMWLPVLATTAILVGQLLFRLVPGLAG